MVYKDKEKINKYRKIYYYKNRLKMLEIAKKYRLANRKKLNLKAKIYRQNNKEKVLLQNKNKYKKFKTKIKLRAKLYYYKNKDIILSKRDKEKVKIYARKNRKQNIIFRLKDSIRSRTKQKYLRGELIKTICEYCGSRDHLEFHHKDYNKPDEVIVLCKKCHLKEHEKIGYKLPIKVEPTE